MGIFLGVLYDFFIRHFKLTWKILIFGWIDIDGLRRKNDHQNSQNTENQSDQKNHHNRAVETLIHQVSDRSLSIDVISNRKHDLKNYNGQV